jgi:hypothetical protein
MSLQAIGNIVIKNVVCEMCLEKIFVKARSDTLKCDTCGARYQFDKSIVCDQHIEYEYNFVGFECLYDDIITGNKCSNLCPSMKMYCKDHSSQEYQRRAEYNIQLIEKRLRDAKTTLDNINESKRIWLIQEVSGLDDGIIQSYEDREVAEMEDMG